MGYLTCAGSAFRARAPARTQQVANPRMGTGNSWLVLSWSSSDEWNVRKRLEGTEPETGSQARSSSS